MRIKKLKILLRVKLVAPTMIQELDFSHTDWRSASRGVLTVLVASLCRKLGRVGGGGGGGVRKGGRGRSGGHTLFMFISNGICLE